MDGFRILEIIIRIKPKKKNTENLREDSEDKENKEEKLNDNKCPRESYYYMSS